MEKRVAELEKASQDIREKLVRVETKLEAIEKTMATKDDLRLTQGAIAVDVSKAILDQTWRLIGVSVVLAGMAFTAARFIH